MKKRLSLLLAVVMMLSILLAVPASAVYNANYFSISFNYVVEGETPYYAPDYISIESSPDGYVQQVEVDTSPADGFTNGVKWERKKVNWYVSVPADEAFVSGAEYRVSVRMKPRSGFQFPTSGSSITANINGTKSSVEWISQELIVITGAVAVKEPEVVDELDLWFLEAPETGESPSFGGGSSTYLSSPSNMIWKDTTTNTQMTESQTFQAGHSYSVSFNMKTNSRYYLKGTRTDPQFTVIGPEEMTGYDVFVPSNGEGAHGIRSVDVTVYFGNIAPVSNVQTVTITGITAPAAGRKPSYNATVSGTGCKSSGYSGDSWNNGVCWVNIDSECAMEPDEKFEQYMTYKVIVEVEALDGYRFPNDVAVTINGEAADSVSFESKQLILATRYFEVPDTFDGWQQEDGEWYYFEDGIPVTGWKQISGKWYYFDSDGVMQTGWQKVSGKWYYFASDGAMRTGWQKVSNKWYYFGSGGAMVTGMQKISGKWYCFESSGVMYATAGWKQVSGKWYYFDSAGVAQTGWKQISGKWYYFNSSAQMVTSWQQISGKWYYFGTDGVMATGWQKISNKWYYFGTDGIMRTGMQKISGKWYCFESSGVMYATAGWKQVSGKWYYFDSAGVAQTGWQQISGKWYYFNSSAQMVTSWQQISGKWYYFGTDGVMATGWQKISGNWYYFESNGVMLANTSKTIGGKTYKFDANGVCTNP